MEPSTYKIMEDKKINQSKAIKMQLDEGTNQRGTFTFTGEDHTLGNLLRSTIIKR